MTTAHFHSIERHATCELCPDTSYERCSTCHAWICADVNCQERHAESYCEEPLVEFLKPYMSHYHAADCPCGLDLAGLSDCYCMSRN